MRKNLVSLFFLMVAVAGFAQKPMLPRDADLENRVQKQLSKMTLDEKIGQMVELEINMISYSNPEYDVRKLMGKSEKIRRLCRTDEEEPAEGSAVVRQVATGQGDE